MDYDATSLESRQIEETMEKSISLSKIFVNHTLEIVFNYNKQTHRQITPKIRRKLEGDQVSARQIAQYNDRRGRSRHV